MTRLEPRQHVGDYEVIDVIGTGGMSTVYRAAHRTRGHQVALKVAERGDGTGDAGARFDHEARILASLAHANIAALHESFEHDGLRCLAMELVDGETLASRLARGPMGAAHAIAIVERIADAAAYMHARGIIHRDLTSSNIRLTRDGRVKVLDFGIAKVRHWKGLTREGHVIGTPAYLSPEQLRTGAATPKSDVWAIGVLLFEMITGRRPFPGAFPHEISRWIGQSAVADLGETPRLASADRARVEALLARCLVVDPAARASSAELTAGSAPRLARLPGLRGRQLQIAGGLAAAIVLTAGVLTLNRAPDPRSVHRIDVVEGVADVLINGARQGRTPLDYQATPHETVTLELRQAGFVPLRNRFVVTERPVWTFAMKRQP